VNPRISEGILGLGLSGNNSLNGSSLLASLVEDAFITQQIFAIYFDDDAYIRFGGFNPDCILFDINYRVNGDYIQWY